MKLKFMYVFVFLAGFSATAQKTMDKLLEKYNTRSIPYISVEELRMLQMNDSIVIFDAREIEEYEVSHIASAENVGFKEFSSEDISEEFPNKNIPIVVYCSVGIRSEQIGEKLEKAGFTQVKNLYGGIFEWKNNNYPVIDSTNKETENVHTFSKLWSKWLLKGTKIYE